MRTLTPQHAAAVTGAGDYIDNGYSCYPSSSDDSISQYYLFTPATLVAIGVEVLVVDVIAGATAQLNTVVQQASDWVSNVTGSP